MIGPSSSSQSEIPNIKFEENPKVKLESTEIGNVTKCHRCQRQIIDLPSIIFSKNSFSRIFSIF